MTTEDPIIDGRDQEELFQTLLARADSYTTDWDPHSDDVGRTLLRIFSMYEHSVRKRLDEVPEKHLLAFLDSLEFDRRRPHAARTPISFDISSDLDRNVPIPGGTTAIADKTDGDNQQFQLPGDGGFEATPARLTDMIAVEPNTDTIVDNTPALENGRIELFEGEDIQSHTLYMEDDSAFNLESGSTFTCRIEATSDAQSVFDRTAWEYYGEDTDGDVGWHPLETVETGQLADDAGVEELREQLRQSAAREQPERATVAEQVFHVPGTITTREINGVESRWIRCERRGRSGTIPASIESIAVRVSTADRETDVEPDMMLSNDTPLSAEDGAVRPFGRNPYPPVMFSVACEEALTKAGGTVEISFRSSEETATDRTDSSQQDEEDTSDRAMGILAGPPQISWEYWNGDGWTRLESVVDGTNSLREDGSVAFEVPEDLEPTVVSGHENVWVRARLVSGNYGQPTFEPPDNESPGGLKGRPDEPVYDEVDVQYEQPGREFETVFSLNNASYSQNLTERQDPFEPFEPLPEDEQSVYFGFNKTLENGPLTLFIPVQDSTYPPSFDPGIQWEYCVDPGQSEWTELDVRDQTGGLTERGIVMLTFPTPTSAFERFDRDRHWIRARVTGDEFDVVDTAIGEGSVPDSQTEQGRDLVDGSTERSTAPPVFEGIYQNTQLAYNTETVEDEVLGSSDGSHDQSFRCAHAPVIDIEVWVDEFSTLSTNECRRLERERPEETQTEYDSRGELTAFWVQWSIVEDFLDSDPRDRDCVVNRTLGTVAFGDGDRGKIPPSGQDNVKATYTTGGGRDGNVAADAVSELKSSIALVDGVTNPLPADGGADIESTETLVRRSTNSLKHRNRAVTAQDYEHVAKAEFSELARVTCDPEHSPDQTRVRVLIVPETERDKPVPSTELKHRVRETLAAQAPAAITENDDADVVVRGPGYSELSITATVEATTIKSVSLLKTQIGRRLDEYLHPLTGNAGEGWRFGELPPREELSELLTEVESVSEVLHFEATFELGEEHHSLVDRREFGVFPEDTLVCSGTHDITVTLGET